MLLQKQCSDCLFVPNITQYTLLSLPLSLLPSQMAEMYGELMEFNEHLHKTSQTKNSVIVKLARTLKLANIPLPVAPELLPREALEPAK